MNAITGSDSEEEYTEQAKDIGFRLATEIRTLRNAVAEKDIIVSNLQIEKQNLIAKYDILYKKYEESENSNRQNDIKIQSLSTHVERLEASYIIQLKY
jgi:hypothetical protein